MRILTLTSLIALAFATTACTKLETGEVGLRKNMNGTIDQSTLKAGYHQVIVGDVIVFSGKEIMLDETDIPAQTAEKSTLKDFDLTFSYDVDESAVFDLYTNYSATSHLRKDNEIFLMANFMKNLVRSAAYGATGNIPALEVNNQSRREEIIAQIRKDVEAKLSVEKLNGKLVLKTVTIRNIQPASAIVDSATLVVARENELAAKRKEVEIAEQEAKRIAMLNSNSRAIEYMNAQSQMKIAEAVAAGKVATIVIPYDFKGMVNIK